MFCCCAAESQADSGTVVAITNEVDSQPSGVNVLDAAAIPALSDTRADAEVPPEKEEEGQPAAEAEPAADAPPAEAALPGPDGEYFGTAAWCFGECDNCKAPIAKGAAVDIYYEVGTEYWRCAVCSGGQASEAAQKCSAEWKQATTKGHVPLTFLVEKRPRTVYASRRPLSLVFKKEIPVVVDKADGHAKELGIEPAWIFIAVDGKMAGDEFQTFFCSFVEIMNRLPGNYSLPLLFELPDGKKKTIIVPTRPLGLVFAKTLPAVTNQSNNLAATLGVEVGWKLLRFADREVSEYETFESFFETFKTTMAKVPEKKA